MLSLFQEVDCPSGTDQHKYSALVHCGVVIFIVREILFGLKKSGCTDLVTLLDEKEQPLRLRTVSIYFIILCISFVRKR